MQSQNCWLYNDQCLENSIEGYYGYVYSIVANKCKAIPKELWLKEYIGKKAFTFSTKKKITKKVIKETGTRKRIERGTKDSGWQNYWGSSKLLQEDLAKYGKENFTRTVLRFCETKNQLSYWEAHYQFLHEVLLNDSYNSWISCKVFKAKL